MVNKDDLNFLILCSLRYCLGRRTYAPDYFREILFKNLDKLTDNTKEIIIQEISDCDDFGSDCDRAVWRRIKERLIKLPKKRLLVTKGG